MLKIKSGFPLTAINKMQEELKQIEGVGGILLSQRNWCLLFGKFSAYHKDAKIGLFYKDAKIDLFTIFTVGKGDLDRGSGNEWMLNLF